jgi:hypothetical protein
MAITYHAGRRIQATSTDFGDNGAGIPAVSGGWKEVGRTTLGSAGDTISVSSLADKRYYMFLNDLTATGGTIAATLRLNNDSGTNYARRRSINGGSDNAYPNDTIMTLNGNTDTNPRFDVGYLANLSSKEKLNITHGVYQNSSGAGTAPTRTEIVNKWENTSDAINRVDVINTGAGDFNTNSEVVVLGWDPDDTHTDNFWEELASGTGSGSSINTGIFTTKKYLHVQIYSAGAASSTTIGTQFNSDTGTNYAERRSSNGGSDASGGGGSVFSVDGNNGTVPMFYNLFIINNASNEKLCIGHSVTQNTAGSGTAPTRSETVAKWANTSSQITSIQWKPNSSTTLNSGFLYKVWGSN